MFRKYDDDGMLLPKYWKCIVCKKRAKYSINLQIFVNFVDEAFPKIDKKELSVIEKHASGEERKNDRRYTTGIAYSQTSEKVDSAYLCKAHLDQLFKAIDKAVE